MENKKTISLATYVLSLIIMGLLVIIIMLFFFKKDKNNSSVPTTPDNNQIASTNVINESEVQNTVKNEIENNTTAVESKTNKKILYTFESADNLAAKGYPRKLNIYEITEDTLEFDYNGGYDFKKQTLDLKLSGTAKSIKDNTYKYTTKVDGNEYEILLEFNKTDNAVKLSDRYNYTGEYSEINLWNTSKTSVKTILSKVSENKNNTEKKTTKEIYKRVGTKNLDELELKVYSEKYIVLDGKSIYFSNDLSDKILEGTYTVDSKNNIDYKFLKFTEDYAFYGASIYRFENINGKKNIVVDNSPNGTMYFEKID